MKPSIARLTPATEPNISSPTSNPGHASASTKVAKLARLAAKVFVSCKKPAIPILATPSPHQFQWALQQAFYGRHENAAVLGGAEWNRIGPGGSIDHGHFADLRCVLRIDADLAQRMGNAQCVAHHQDPVEERCERRLRQFKVTRQQFDPVRNSRFV